MKKMTSLLIVLLPFSFLLACGDDAETTSPDTTSPDVMDVSSQDTSDAVTSAVTWDESDSAQGELSGDLGNPTQITLNVGDNHIIGTSVPGATEECIDAPDGSKAPYYPEHASYTDAFSFTLGANQKLVAIIVESIEVEAVHSACGLPLESQFGAFTALAASDKIDWNSDTFENFVQLPSENPLVGAGFAKSVGDDLLAQYKAGFNFGPYSIEALAADPSDGTYTFWWKEGANNASYTLNFVVEETTDAPE